MERRIIVDRTQGNFVLLNNELSNYYLRSGEICCRFNIDKLVSDESYYEMAIQKGYKYYSKSFWDEKDEYQVIKTPISKNFTKDDYLSLLENDGEEAEYIYLSNYDLNGNVESFYQFSLEEIEIEGIRMEIVECRDFKDLIYIRVPYKNEKLKSEMTAILGEPEIPSDIGYDKYSPSFYYIIPTSRIDKVIGIKHFRGITNFGDCEAEKFTGEVEEIVLNLRDFDENVFQIFEKHNALKIDYDIAKTGSYSLRAKELFCACDGDKNEMMQRGELEEYLTYDVPPKMEQQWIDQLFNKKYDHFNINNANSLIILTKFITLHTASLLVWLNSLDYYIINNLYNCITTKQLKQMRFLVDSILEDLYRISAEEKDQQTEPVEKSLGLEYNFDRKKYLIIAFKEQKKRIQIRRIKISVITWLMLTLFAYLIIWLMLTLFA